MIYIFSYFFILVLFAVLQKSCKGCRRWPWLANMETATENILSIPLCTLGHKVVFLLSKKTGLLMLVLYHFYHSFIYVTFKINATVFPTTHLITIRLYADFFPCISMYFPLFNSECSLFYSSWQYAMLPPNISS